MEAITKTTILTCTVVAAILMLFASGGKTLAGTTMSVGMMGGGMSGATGWIWVPGLLAVIVLGLAVVSLMTEEE